MTTRKDQVTVYMDTEVRDKIKALAKKNDRSFSWMLQQILMKGLESYESEGEK